MATASNSRVEDTLFAPAMAIDKSRTTFWVPEMGVRIADLTVDMGTSKRINYLRIEEAIRYGQRVKGFKIEGYANGLWVTLAEGTTIGRSRILKLDTPAEVSKVRLKIKDARGAPAIRLFGAYFYEN
ncbi:MAG: discoidin domain-containing protein [Ignavibacteriales bacterium]|nr:discoidin domain-containing protein [Ignavibacteriales bacterium]